MTNEWSMRVPDDPVFQEGLMELDYKNLWIAKGTFCPNPID
jgi:hypothetical protein